MHHPTDRITRGTVCVLVDEAQQLLFMIRPYMAKDRSAKRGNPLPPLHGLHFPISSKGSFTHRRDSTNLVVEHWLERKIAMWFHHEG